MSDDDEENSNKQIYTAPHITRVGAKDFKDLGITEEQLLASLTRLQQRHEELLKTNVRYAELCGSVPDRSGWSSGVPINERVVAPFVHILNGIHSYETGFKKWSKVGTKNKTIRDKKKVRERHAAEEAAKKNQK